MDLVVGLDMATAHVRAMAVDATGRCHAQAGGDLPEHAREWWPAVARVLADLSANLGSDRSAIVALSVCGTSGTVVALDRAGEVVGPTLLYSDQRALEEAEAVRAAGLPVQPSWGLPKWGWLVRRHPDVARLAHAPDLVVSGLVGGPAPTDWSHALKSGYDPERGAWATEALAALGISPDLVPDVLHPTARAGTVSGEAAAATGLPPGCEVRLGMTDACAAQVAAGASEPGRFVSVLGTTLAVKGVSHDLVHDPEGAVYSHRHPDGWWMPGGASSTGARILAEQFGDGDLAALDDEAGRHGPASAVTYPLIGRGERFPFTVPDAEGFWVDEPADEGERYRAILEGVAFVERLAYERLAEIGAPPRPPVALSGGGSRSRVWNRIRATVLGQPAVAKPGATTALGACILAAAGTLHPDLASATRAMAVDGQDVEPLEAEADELQGNYERFVAALVERGWWRPS